MNLFFFFFFFGGGGGRKVRVLPPQIIGYLEKGSVLELVQERRRPIRKEVRK